MINGQKKSEDNFELIFFIFLIICTIYQSFRIYNLGVATNGHYESDFLVLYNTSKELFNSHPNPYNSVTKDYYPYLYPPFFLPMLKPLAYVDYYFSYLIWIGLQVGFYIYSLKKFLLSRTEIFKNPSLRIALIFSFPFITFTCLSGQMGILTSALILLGCSYIDKKPLFAGFMFSLITFKPQLAATIPIFLIASKNWKALIAFLSTTLIICALSLAYYGMGTWAAFFEALKTHSYVMEIGPEKLLKLMISPYANLRIIGLDYSTAITIQAIASILSAWLTFSSFRNKLKQSYIIWFVAIFLFSPYSFCYDAAILGVVAYYLWANFNKHKIIRLVTIITAFLPAIVVQAQSQNIPFSLICLAPLIYLLRNSSSQIKLAKQR